VKVPFIDLARHHNQIKKELYEAFERVLVHSQFILGDEVKQLESEIASYLGVKHAIGVSNGTNALMLALKAYGIGPGDEVITTPFTFVATAEVISVVGARPVFCDVDPFSYNIDTFQAPSKITPNTKAVIPVHLYGQSANMDDLLRIKNINHDIKIIEDMAQAIGARHKNRMVGTFGDIACISFFPTKNLNALGDGGMIVTDDDEADKKIRQLRVHGASKKYHHDMIGYNERLDGLQAAFLRVKLPWLDKWNARRREIADFYTENLKNIIQIPQVSTENISVFHQYSIRTKKRDELRRFLSDKGVGTEIHYPKCLHLQDAFKYLGYKMGDFPVAESLAEEVLSLPIHQDLTDDETRFVVDMILEYFSK
jgi:dTDP-4-amino-4,6-dideoxygalactose transaminase